MDAAMSGISARRGSLAAPSITSRSLPYVCSLLLLVAAGLLLLLPLRDAPCSSVSAHHSATVAPAFAVALRSDSSGTAAFTALEAITNNESATRFAFFHFPLGFGLQNNMAFMRYQHLAAKWASRTLVLPRTMTSRGRLALQNWHHGAPNAQSVADSEWRDVPLERFIDVDYFRACTARLGIRSLSADEADAAGVPAPVILPDHGYTTLKRVAESASDPRVSVESPRIGFGNEIIKDRRDLISQVNAYDACLSYNPDLYRTAALLGKSIEKKFGIPVGRMVTLHARMEDDMLELFQHVGNLKFCEARMKVKIKECMLKAAPPSEVESEKRPLFVLTGEPFSHDKYEWLRTAYGELAVTKEDIEPDLIEDLRLKNGLDAGVAIVDVIMAQESGLFVGCFCSSLSVRIAQYRHKLGRPSYMYNGARWTRRVLSLHGPT